FLRPVDERVVHLHLAQHPGQRDHHEQHRNRPERDRLQRRADHSGVSFTGKKRWRIFAVVTAATAPHRVETMVVEMIEVGFLAPAAASTPMIVAGMNWMPA